MNLDQDELDEFIRQYDQVVEETLEECKSIYQNLDEDLALGESKDEDFETAWDVAQQTSDNLSQNDFAFDARLAEAAIHKERDDQIDWTKPKRRFVEYGVPDTRDSISSFTPIGLSLFISDEIINHAVATDIIRRFDYGE